MKSKSFIFYRNLFYAVAPAFTLLAFILISKGKGIILNLQYIAPPVHPIL